MWVVLLSLGNSMLYMSQAEIVSAATSDAVERTRIFATIEQWTGLLQVLLQLALTGRLIKKFGTGIAAAFLPVIFAMGYGAMFFAPVLAVVMAFQVAQRTANFAISNPAREVLFTVAEREDKYKAKNVVDGVMFRGADVLWAWVFNLLSKTLMMTIPAIALATVPAMLGWAGLSLLLGRMQEKRAALQSKSP